MTGKKDSHEARNVSGKAAKEVKDIGKKATQEIRMDRTANVLKTLRTQTGFTPKPFYGPNDVADLRYDEEIGDPGSYPYTRGRFPDLYRKMLWVKHRACGYETVEKSNEWFKWLIERGADSIRIVPDVISHAGIDPDHPLIKDVVGITGPPIYSLDSFSRAVEGISLQEGIDFACGTGAWDDVFKYASLLCLARKKGIAWSELRGAMVNDPLHAYGMETACPQPLELAWRISLDGMEFCATHTPKRYMSSPCGYDMRESGIDTVQELAFILLERIESTDELIRRGIKFEQIAPRMPLQFSGEIDFFETVCKLRAGRRMWAKIARNRYKSNDVRSMRPPTSINCAGSSLVAQQPVFNIIRLTGEVMASVLGGAGAIEHKAFDEPLALPGDETENVSYGIHEIVAHEMNIPLVTDPLGGSYYVEWLTSKIETEATELMKKVEDLGGFKAAVKQGWIQTEVRKAVLTRKTEIENNEIIKVCVNAFQHLAHPEMPVRLYEYEGAEESIKGVVTECVEYKKSREVVPLRQALLRLKAATKEGVNIMPALLEALDCCATYGELMGMIREGMDLEYDAYKLIKRPSYLSS